MNSNIGLEMIMQNVILLIFSCPSFAESSRRMSYFLFSVVQALPNLHAECHTSYFQLSKLCRIFTQNVILPIFSCPSFAESSRRMSYFLFSVVQALPNLHAECHTSYFQLSKLCRIFTQNVILLIFSCPSFAESSRRMSYFLFSVVQALPNLHAECHTSYFQLSKLCRIFTQNVILLIFSCPSFAESSRRMPYFLFSVVQALPNLHAECHTSYFQLSKLCRIFTQNVILLIFSCPSFAESSRRMSYFLFSVVQALPNLHAECHTSYFQLSKLCRIFTQNVILLIFSCPSFAESSRRMSYFLFSVVQALPNLSLVFYIPGEHRQSPIPSLKFFLAIVY